MYTCVENFEYRGIYSVTETLNKEEKQKKWLFLFVTANSVNLKLYQDNGTKKQPLKKTDKVSFVT